jgi:hypothetical protein
MGDQTQPLGPHRRDLYAVISCTTLPLPREVTFFDRGEFHTPFVDLDMDVDAADQVDAWAAAYGGTAELGSPGAPHQGRVQRTYRVETKVAGWDVTVRSYVRKAVES